MSIALALYNYWRKQVLSVITGAKVERKLKGVIMNLTTDAETLHEPFKVLFGKRTLNIEVLREIEKDLKTQEQISLIFLIMKDPKVAFKEVQSLKLHHEHHMVSAFVQRNNLENWEEKFLESLAITQNNIVIENLGLKIDVIKDIYILHISNCGVNVNKVIKVLYTLCESLDSQSTKKLLKLVHDDGLPKEEQLNHDDCLELHILNWIQKNYIAISLADGKWGLKKLLGHLKVMELSDSEIYRLLKKHNDDTKSVAQYGCDMANQEPSSLGNQNPTSDAGENSGDSELEVYKINTGLCIIINEVHFKGEKNSNYDERVGAEKDVDALNNTFGENCFGFEIKKYEDLTQEQIYNRLENVYDNYDDDADYDCVVVCILSHGVKGGIISADGKQCPIETIEEKLCSKRLIGKPKVIIIQACQGNNIGVDPSLVTDGVKTVNFENMGETFVFCATIPGFAAIRDEKKGSWFIQDLCEVLRKREGLSIDDCATEVKRILKKRRGKLHGVKDCAQISKSTTTLTKTLIFPKICSSSR